MLLELRDKDVKPNPFSFVSTSIHSPLYKHFLWLSLVSSPLHSIQHSEIPCEASSISSISSMAHFSSLSLMLLLVLLVGSTVAISPAKSPLLSPKSRVHSHSPSPSPVSSEAPASSPTSIAAPPSEAPGPAVNGAVLNRVGFAGSVAVGVFAAALVL